MEDSCGRAKPWGSSDLIVSMLREQETCRVCFTVKVLAGGGFRDEGVPRVVRGERGDVKADSMHTC